MNPNLSEQFRDFVMLFGETDLKPTYEKIERKIKDNMDWMEANMAPIENWLKAVNSGQN